MAKRWKPGSSYPIWVGDGDSGNVMVSFKADRKYEMPENAWLGVDVTAVLLPEQALELADEIKRSAIAAKRVKDEG